MALYYLLLLLLSLLVWCFVMAALVAFLYASELLVLFSISHGSRGFLNPLVRVPSLSLSPAPLGRRRRPMCLSCSASASTAAFFRSLSSYSSAVMTVSATAVTAVEKPSIAFKSGST